MLTTSVMIKPASGNCNMRCKYCFYCDEMENRQQKLYGFMSDETLKNVIRKTILQTERQITFAFQGGEPTLRGLDFFRKVLVYEKQYNRNHIEVCNVLQTNGYGLTEEWCRFFRDNHFLIGVSVDGQRELHDSNRRTAGSEGPTYDRILSNIKLLEKYHVDYNILTVVTEKMACNAHAVYSNYKSRGWHFQQYIECLDPLGKDFCSSPYSLHPESYGYFLTDLFNLWYEDVMKGTQPYIRRFENYIGILIGYQPEACEQRGECGIQFVVEADGSAYPCDFYMLDEYRLGNFNTEGILQMNEKRTEIAFVERSRKLSSRCKSCPYYRLCRGGCQRTREYLPEEDAYISHFCIGYQYFFGHCLSRMEDLAKRIMQ